MIDENKPEEQQDQPDIPQEPACEATREEVENSNDSAQPTDFPDEEPTQQSPENHTSTDGDETDDTVSMKPFLMEKQHFAMGKDTPLKTEVKPPKGGYNHLNTVHLPPMHALEAEERLEGYDVQKEVTTDKLALWWDKVVNGMDASLTGGEYLKALERVDSEWNQFVATEKGQLGLSVPRFGDKGTMLTGIRAQLKVSAIMGLGSAMVTPLWHTGLWIKFMPPSDAALFEIERRCAEEKALLGRKSSGLVYSNSQVYLASYLIDLMLSCIYDWNQGAADVNTLKDRIKMTDLAPMLWGFLCTIYPNGYPYSLPCLNSPHKCNHTSHGQLSFAKIMFFDKSRLTPYQINHMHKREQHVTDEELDRYQKDSPFGGDKLVSVKVNNREIKLMLTVPTLSQYLDAGFKWVENIEQTLSNSFARMKSGESRNIYIEQMSKTMTLLQYSQWVKAIQYVEDEENPEETTIEFNEREEVEKMLETFSKDDDLTVAIIKEIGNYIDDSTMAVAGIPRFDCPKCQIDMGNFLPNGQYIIPIDLMKIFFTLLNQRLLKVTYSTNE